MRISKLEDYHKGWFVGGFTPTAYFSTHAEVCYRIHPKGEDWPRHYHKIGVEINLLIKGSMTINDTLIHEGEVFIIDPYEITKPTYLTDCELIIIKLPSVPGDKYES